jgi:hypothetical protein
VSAFQVVIDVSEVLDFAILLQRAPEIVRPELHRAALEGSLLLERAVKDLTPVGIGGGGGLRGSIAAQPTAQLGEEVIGVVGTAMAYAVPVELGTRPHFPPIQPLKDWVRLKLDIRDDDEAEGVAWAIARKIAVHGTEGVHMFRDAFEQNRRQVVGMFEAAHGRIVAKLAAGHA